MVSFAFWKQIIARLFFFNPFQFSPKFYNINQKSGTPTSSLKDFWWFSGGYVIWVRGPVLPFAPETFLRALLSQNASHPSTQKNTLFQPFGFKSPVNTGVPAGSDGCINWPTAWFRDAGAAHRLATPPRTAVCTISALCYVFVPGACDDCFEQLWSKKIRQQKNW